MAGVCHFGASVFQNLTLLSIINMIYWKLIDTLIFNLAVNTLGEVTMASPILFLGQNEA